ncbi:hypothetical protein [Paraflavitalea sp. CAU 1676]|uniref:hypothetical protein n=1 Tax=Paraflavitalea sp. CAU 1676 TaxID=3032598 RepID=UPI0023DA4DE0|nr:hypothetical protein [Paraflavitalea sp. CAU 1676]MDF2192756.1 hypothetical protein [Paraflavitalea sp. CAU 1676]
MTIDRINQLFENGHISAEEHNELINQSVAVVKKNSTYSYWTIGLGLTGYLLMLTFTKNGHEFSLLGNGTQRLWAGTIFSLLGLFTFLKARAEIEAQQYKQNLAYIGIGVIAAVLMVSIPVHLMSL